MENSNLKKAQNIMLEILIEVDRICKKHNINYWLDSGTLLGAIRHKGFIPWDDDLDISMKLEDYNKFCKIAQQELPDGMFLQTSQTDKAFPYDFAKIRSNKGKIVEKHEVGKKVEYNQGVFIDIIPCVMIKNTLFNTFYYRFMFLLVKLFSYKYLNIRKIRENLIKLIDKLNLDNDEKNIKVIRSGKFPSKLLYVEKDVIFPVKKIPFEGVKFFAPNNPDKYLRTLYGDNYMQLPPENNRHIHADKIEVF